MSEPTPNQKKVKEPLWKELSQCQYCYKSRLSEGVSLSRCAGCGTAYYCNKECQKLGWPSHKATCKINQNQFMGLGSSASEALKTLRAFTSKHRPTIAFCGVLAFDLCLNPARGLDEILVIMLMRRPGEKRVEKAFIVTDAYLRLVDTFDDQSKELRSQVKAYHDDSIQKGYAGGIMVMLWDQVSNVSNIAGVAFGQDTVDLEPGRPWMEEMITKINSGLVF